MSATLDRPHLAGDRWTEAYIARAERIEQHPLFPALVRAEASYEAAGIHPFWRYRNSITGGYWGTRGTGGARWTSMQRVSRLSRRIYDDLAVLWPEFYPRAEAEAFIRGVARDWMFERRVPSR